jgi:hypothetical protein
VLLVLVVAQCPVVVVLLLFPAALVLLVLVLLALVRVRVRFRLVLDARVVMPAVVLPLPPVLALAAPTLGPVQAALLSQSRRRCRDDRVRVSAVRRVPRPVPATAMT